jgi:hypothetical protein
MSAQANASVSAGPEQPSDRSRWRVTKNLIIIIGSLLAASWTVANLALLYYAKLYLFDRPALTISAEASQLPAEGNDKNVLVNLRLENNGVRPFRFDFDKEKPIVVIKADRGSDGEFRYTVVKDLSLPSSFPEGENGKLIVRDIKALTIAPGEVHRQAVLATVPVAGTYIFEFSVVSPYRGVWEWIGHKLSLPPSPPTYSFTSAAVTVK